jgi:hypothetical protein
MLYAFGVFLLAAIVALVSALVVDTSAADRVLKKQGSERR